MLVISTSLFEETDNVQDICATCDKQLVAIATQKKIVLYWSSRQECVRIGQYKHAISEDGSIVSLRFNQQSTHQPNQPSIHQLAFLTSKNIVVICQIHLTISNHSTHVSLKDNSQFDNAILTSSSSADHWSDPLIADSLIPPTLRIHLAARVRLTNDEITSFAPSINQTSKTSIGWTLASITGFLQSIDDNGKPGVCRGDMGTPIVQLESSETAKLIVFLTADGRVHWINHGAVDLQESKTLETTLTNNQTKSVKATSLSINDSTGMLAIGYENATIDLYRLTNAQLQHVTKFSLKLLSSSSKHSNNHDKSPSHDLSIPGLPLSITSLSLHNRAPLIAVGLNSGLLVVSDFNGCVLYEKQHTSFMQTVALTSPVNEVADPAVTSGPEPIPIDTLNQLESAKDSTLHGQTNGDIATVASPDISPVFSWCSNGLALIHSQKRINQVERVSFLIQSTLLGQSDPRQGSAPFVGETAVAVIKQKPSFDALKHSSRRRPQPQFPSPINQSVDQKQTDHDDNHLEGLPRLSSLSLTYAPPSFLSFASPLLLSCISPRTHHAAVAARQGLAIVELHNHKWHTFHLPAPVHAQQIGFYGEDCVVCMLKVDNVAYAEIHQTVSRNVNARIQRLVDPLTSPAGQDTTSTTNNIMSVILFFSRSSLDVRNALYCIEVVGECSGFDIDQHVLAVCSKDMVRVCFLSLDVTIQASQSVNKSPCVASVALQYPYHPHNQLLVGSSENRSLNTDTLPYSLSFSLSCSVTTRPPQFHKFVAVITSWISLPPKTKDLHVIQLAIQEARRILLATDQNIQVFTVNSSKETALDCSTSGDHLFLPPSDISELCIVDTSLSQIYQTTKLNRSLRSLRLCSVEQTGLTAFINHPSRSPWSVDAVRLLPSEPGLVAVGIDWYRASILSVKPNSLVVRSRPFLDQLAAHCIKLNALPFVRDLLGSGSRADSTSSLAAELLVNQALHSSSVDASQLASILALLKHDELFVRTVARVARQNDAHYWPVLFKAARCTPAECALRAMNEGQFDVASWLLTVVQRTHSLKEARVIAIKLRIAIPVSHEYSSLHRTVSKFIMTNQKMQTEEQEMLNVAQAKTQAETLERVSPTKEPYLVPAASAPTASVTNQTITSAPLSLRAGSEPVQPTENGSCVIS